MVHPCGRDSVFGVGKQNLTRSAISMPENPERKIDNKNNVVCKTCCNSAGRRTSSFSDTGAFLRRRNCLINNHNRLSPHDDAHSTNDSFLRESSVGAGRSAAGAYRGGRTGRLSAKVCAQPNIVIGYGDSEPATRSAAYGSGRTYFSVACCQFDAWIERVPKRLSNLAIPLSCRMCLRTGDFAPPTRVGFAFFRLRER